MNYSYVYASCWLFYSSISDFTLQLVSISKDNSGIVWNAKDGKKHTDLKWAAKTTEQYRFRGCWWVLKMFFGGQVEFYFYK